MPDNFIPKEFFNLKTIIQLIAGILFLGVGIFILITHFDNNYILIGTTKYMFGGILSLYGIVRIARVYLNWKTQKNYWYEKDEE
jgi:uncharacterized membrane protein HdeD (DUF308 family)